MGTSEITGGEWRDQGRNPEEQKKSTSYTNSFPGKQKVKKLEMITESK